MWSRTRKQLENLICDALKNRVKFFVTQYRKSHDQHGRACIVVDGKEVFDMCDLKYNIKAWDKETELKENPELRRYKESYPAFWEADEIIREQGSFNEDHFFDALIQYLNNPIDNSLKSENMIVVILALLDRRVGKRTLNSLNKEMEKQHTMVRYFYKLRCEAEGLL
ncbi:SF0329 family protein [Inconstantimicrobium mannanitabidum]|uniref:Uncharacterized protein n=1 Tax=Inconstantimicrobium mannanitabidum TaxID=1604901 RepID=A0ACB5RBG1_9CLOT|nr:hypothetical protein [Clostridium sp. TW13]GKX66411.1 hypothetical protein rsdtw13_16690 [Clostridium sp. TW13]